MNEEEIVSWLFANPDTVAAVALVIAVSVLVTWLVLKLSRPRRLCRNVADPLRRYAVSACRNFRSQFAIYGATEKKGDKTIRRIPHLIGVGGAGRNITLLCKWPDDRYKHQLDSKTLAGIAGKLGLPPGTTGECVPDGNKGKWFQVKIVFTLPVDASAVTPAQVQGHF